MKKIILLTFCLFVAVLVTGCGDNSPTYKVNKSTYLYAELSADSANIAELSVGTQLIPADGETLNCESFVDTGMTFTLCKMQVEETGQTGWVLQQWITEE